MEHDELLEAFEEDPFRVVAEVAQVAAHNARQEAVQEIAEATRTYASATESELLGQTVLNDLTELYGADEVERRRERLAERLQSKPLPLDDPRGFAAAVHDEFKLAGTELDAQEERDYWDGVRQMPSTRFGSMQYDPETDTWR